MPGKFDSLILQQLSRQGACPLKKLVVLGISAFCLVTHIASGQDFDDPGAIALPDDPSRVAAPPEIDEDMLEREQLEKKSKAREIRNKKFEKPPKDPSKVRDSKLLSEMVEQRPNNFLLSLNLVYPLAQVTGPREEYIFEPSTVISAFLRIGQIKVYTDYVVWTGFRMANFAGTGIYDSIPGRFGFSYFGPMIGVGRIDPAPASLPREASNPNVDPGKFLSSRGGAFFVAGVAAQSRFAETFAGSETPKEDLNEMPAGFDAPGIWGEGHYSWIHFGALSINFLAGVQLGSGKTIVYFGGGFGGVH
jgi:hypothetical protein